MNDRLTAENLTDAGCSREMLERFEALHRTNRPEEEVYASELRLLRSQRSVLLDDLHDVQRKLSCLDYLTWQLRENHEGGRKLQ